MKKTLLSLLVALVMCVSLAACGSGGGGDLTADVFDKAKINENFKNVKVVITSKMDGETVTMTSQVKGNLAYQKEEVAGETDETYFEKVGDVVYRYRVDGDEVTKDIESYDVFENMGGSMIDFYLFNATDVEQWEKDGSYYKLKADDLPEGYEYVKIKVSNDKLSEIAVKAEGDGEVSEMTLKFTYGGASITLPTVTNDLTAA